MAGRYNPDDYEPVEDRIRAFWEKWPDGGITTQLLHHDEKRFIVEARAYATSVNTVGGRLLATGLAEETIGSSPVNRTNALENCETSAIGRALANAGFAPKGKRPSREEMEKADRVTPAAGARDYLREQCERFDIDMNAVKAAYQRLHNEDLRNEEDAGKIRAFTAKLMNEPKKILGEPEEVKQE